MASEEFPLVVTDTAVHRIRVLQKKENRPAASLRLRIIAGGCSGMTDESLLAEEAAAAPPPETPQPSQSFPSRFGGLTGAIGPVITTLIAFLMGGLVVGLTGKDPIKVYHAILNGTGIGWFFHVGNHSARIPFSTAHMWFPWDTASTAAQNLQQGEGRESEREAIRALSMSGTVRRTASEMRKPAA